MASKPWIISDPRFFMSALKEISNHPPLSRQQKAAIVVRF